MIERIDDRGGKDRQGEADEQRKTRGYSQILHRALLAVQSLALLTARSGKAFNIS
jgi:hypothetical protein